VNLWRLEWYRLVRTRRLVALVGVYVFFGFLGPLTARFLGDILDLAGGDLEGAVIELPPPAPIDGMAQYASNAMQVGTLVAVVVAAGALALDAIPEMGVFLRTRSDRIWPVLAPRFVVAAVAAGVAFCAGAAVAWYETWALIGPPDAGGVVAGVVGGCLYLVFASAVVAAVAARARSVLGTVLISLLALLLLPILGVVDPVGRWLPSRLASALAVLPAGPPDVVDYLPAVGTTLLATLGLLVLAARLSGTREV
jgi:ABC-2 type transport system permease protein